MKHFQFSGSHLTAPFKARKPLIVSFSVQITFLYSWMSGFCFEIKSN